MLTRSEGLRPVTLGQKAHGEGEGTMRSVTLSAVNRALLGSAAGIFAVTSGQAADLPVKAAPVQYVKVCNIYGAGFWYVPGTDTCIKFGTYARIDFVEGNSGSGVPLGSPNATSLRQRHCQYNRHLGRSQLTVGNQ